MEVCAHLTLKYNSSPTKKKTNKLFLGIPCIYYLIPDIVIWVLVEVLQSVTLDDVKVINRFIMIIKIKYLVLDL